MKNPNGFGTIRYDKRGKRRRPYTFLISKKVLQPDGTYKNKQVVVEHFATLREAKKFQVEYWDNPFDPEYKDITFKDVYEQHVLPDVEKRKPSAKKNRKAAFKKCEAIHDMKIREIRHSHVKALLESYTHQATSTLGALKVLLHDVFNFCMAEGIISNDPMIYQKVTSEKESEKRTSWTREDVHLIWDNLDFVIEPKPDGVTAYVKKTPMMDTVLILIYTGVRIEEFLNIKTQHINLEKRYIEIFGTKTGASERFVPIHKDILPFIEKRMGQEYLIHNNGKQMSYKTYKERFFDPMKEALGLEREIHETRHTFSTFTALCNFNSVIRKKIIGHKLGNITDDVYTHIFIEDMVKEIDKLVI